jgi:hypothetical protein
MIWQPDKSQTLLQHIWHDPVWSAVIAAIIAAIVLWLANRYLKLLRRLKLFLVRALCGKQTAPVNIVKVGETDVVEDKTPGRSYPIKAYCILRNDSVACADVRVADYTAGAVTLKKFLTEVLQAKSREWYPDKSGVDRIAVLPGQQFRAWVGADENIFTKDQVERLKGRIGTLILIVNGERMEITL